MRLANKTALITGGNSGIGLATARRFVAEGARGVITGRNQATLDAAASELGPNAFAVVADATDIAATDAAIAKGAGKFGNYDVVFANAGIAVTVLTSDPDTSAFDVRLEAAISSGCGGVVCSVQEIERVHRAAAEFVTIVPGVRLAGEEVHDQARVGTPEAVARAGGDLLVVGRAVTAAPDPRAAARRISDAVREAFGAT